MQLVLRAKRFVAVSTYAEKDIPKSAGFRWDATGRCWYTTDETVAAKLIRYADTDARARLQAVAERREQALAASRATDADVDLPRPDGLEYLPFQKAGIAYALGREATLMGDEMGLGKTVEAIGVINADPSIQKAMIICPASLKINWRRELERWLVRPLSIEIANGSGFPTSQVVIINFDVLKKHSEALHAIEWDLVVADEAHFLKNRKAQRTEQVFGTDPYLVRKASKAGKPINVVPLIKARRRLLLTGTPIANRPAELFPLINYLDPQTWGNFFAYAKRYCDAGSNGWGYDFSGANRQTLPELQEKLRASVMVRRLKSEVLTELPPKRRSIIEVPANGASQAVQAENNAYGRNEATLAVLRAKAELAKASDNQAEYKAAVDALREAASTAFSEIARLRHDTAVAKVPAVVDHVKDLLEETDKLVVFAHHHDVSDALMEALGDIAVLHRGDLNEKAKDEAVKRFQNEVVAKNLRGNDSAVRVFVGSILASGVGITLTAASTVVFAELDWVPGNVSQAEDRCHRIGQRDFVVVHHIVIDGSLDAKMAKLIVEKQDVIDRALDRPDPVVLAEPATPVDQHSASASTSYDKLGKIAETITPEQAKAVLQGLRFLAGADDDHARLLNNIGFNKVDSHIGHEIAQRPSLSKRQAALGKLSVVKYRRQLPEELVAAIRGEEAVAA